MSKLSFFAHDYDGRNVRVTEDKRFSIYDVFVAFGICGKSNASKTLKRIEERHPEVRTIWINFKFSGRGQKETPVATEEGIYEILMLCPGKKAAKFRRWAAGIIADPDKAIAHGTQKFLRQGKSEKWVKNRVEGILTRHKFTDTLKEHGVSGVGYAQCTDEINTQVIGHTAKQIKALRKVTKTRDGLSDVELAALNLAELISEKEIEKRNSQGNDECCNACRDAGSKVARIFE